MQKSQRELLKWARDFGVDNAKVIQGAPHGRLTGTIDGKPFAMVVSLSKCTSIRGFQLFKQNIRAKIAELRSQ